MASYLIKLTGLIGFCVYIISLYYGVPFHNETATGYATYVMTVLVVYGMYKGYSIFAKGPTVEFSPISIAGYFLLHLFILSIIYFQTVGGSGGFVLFFQMFGYLLLPLAIILVSYSSGKYLISKLLPTVTGADTTFRFVLSLGIGFVLFLTPLVILGSLGAYNLWSVIAITLVLVAVSHSELIDTLRSLWTYRIRFDNHRSEGSFLEQINLPLLSTEFLFIVLSFLISVSFINIMRPMPIGWDDLGAYMNFPQIIANNGALVPGMGMATWQTLTGIGFMFHSAPQAFFMNQIGGILSVVVLTVVLASLLPREKKTLINLPLLGATMFYTMPMVIFQQAKDMKLDPGLFFVSVIAIYGLLHLLQTSLRASGESKISRESLISLGLVGVIAGLAFVIKITTLMLIIASLAAICFGLVWLSGFFAFLGFFVAIFTQFDLWSRLNVSYPKDDANLLQTVTIVAFVFGLSSLAFAWKKYGGAVLRKTTIYILVLLSGVLLPTVPWLIKNAVETRADGISINNLLNGKPESLRVDFTKIHSKEALSAIEKANQVEAITSSGKSQNEDLGRYFGYDDGVNNYLKLPRNLTMQSNQSGEYTEITYFYLALIPVVFLFLAYRSPLWLIGVVLALIAETLYFFIPQTGVRITEFFATQNLPGGYVWIALAVFLPVVYFAYALKKDEPTSETFGLNLSFASVYVFLFVIAAYGIVWYGISMYFCFLVMILLAAWHIVRVENSEDSPENLVRFLGSLAFITLVSTYFLLSAIPHGWNNLKSASFNEFKAGAVSQEEAIFQSHPDYFAILTTLNLNDETKLLESSLAGIRNDILKKVILGNMGEKKTLKRFEQIVREVVGTDLVGQGATPQDALAIRTEARNILDTLYNTVLYPPKELQNTAGIYRIGTFLTYFISNNQRRYYDDSLVMSFGQYFYDANPDVAVERMKKIGLKYFLVDLNAATIDRDPRHDLTKRYENLLATFRSDKLELIQTDSLCLQVALVEKNTPEYLTYAGVNYESYQRDASGNETSINRGQKQVMCYNHILDLIKQGKITDKDYPFLLPIKNYIDQTKPQGEAELMKIFQSYVGHGWLALFKIK